MFQIANPNFVCEAAYIELDFRPVRVNQGIQATVSPLPVYEAILGMNLAVALIDPFGKAVQASANVDGFIIQAI
jgi:hypothetical protein